jgi:hypothetical protein
VETGWGGSLICCLGRRGGSWWGVQNAININAVQMIGKYPVISISASSAAPCSKKVRLEVNIKPDTTSTVSRVVLPRISSRPGTASTAPADSTKRQQARYQTPQHTWSSRGAQARVQPQGGSHHQQSQHQPQQNGRLTQRKGWLVRCQPLPGRHEPLHVGVSGVDINSNSKSSMLNPSFILGDSNPLVSRYLALAQTRKIN